MRFRTDRSSPGYDVIHLLKKLRIFFRRVASLLLLKIPIRAPASAKKNELTFLTTRLVFESRDENSWSDLSAWPRIRKYNTRLWIQNSRTSSGGIKFRSFHAPVVGVWNSGSEVWVTSQRLGGTREALLHARTPTHSPPDVKTGRGTPRSLYTLLHLCMSLFCLLRVLLFALGRVLTWLDLTSAGAKHSICFVCSWILKSNLCTLGLLNNLQM